MVQGYFLRVLFIYLLKREKECKQRKGQRQRERQRISSKLCTEHRALHTEALFYNPEIMT